MTAKLKSADPDILASFPALVRAAKNARKLAKKTGIDSRPTRNGKISRKDRMLSRTTRG